jgi:Domain of unknown function (DUF4148)
MNTKHIIAAVAIAFAGTGAFATEATQFTDTPSTQSRAVVKAEVARALAAGELNVTGEAYGQYSPMVTSVRSRADVRAEAFYAARHQDSQLQLYVGA